MVSRTHSHSDENNRPSEEKIRELKQNMLSSVEESSRRMARLPRNSSEWNKNLLVNLACTASACSYAVVLNDWSGIKDSDKENFLLNMT
jgi:hypothetical protein